MARQTDKRDDQMRLCIDGGLNIPVDHAAVAGAGRNGSRIGICRGYLAFRSIGQRPIHGLQVLNVLADAPVLPDQMRDLIGADLAFLLPIDADHLIDVAFDVRLKIGDAAGDLALGYVAVAVVHRPEFAAVGSNARTLRHADARHSSTNCAQVRRIPGPLSRRKSAMVL